MLFPAAYLLQNRLFKERLMLLKLVLFLSIEPFSSWRFSVERKNSPLFFQKKNRKKESFLSSGRTSRYKGGAQRSLYYPCIGIGLELIFALLFLVLAPVLNLNCWLMVPVRRENRKKRLRPERKGQAAMRNERIADWPWSGESRKRVRPRSWPGRWL